MKDRQIKQLRSVAKKQQAQAMQSAQIAINAVMWQSIKDWAKQGTPEEEYDPNADAILTVPYSEIADVPKEFTLNVTHDPEAETVVITASRQQPRSPIILPNMEN